MRVLAVANWDPSVTRVAWAIQRLDSLRRHGVEVDLLAEPCANSRRGWLALRQRLDEKLVEERYDVVAPLYGSVLGLVCVERARARGLPCAMSFAGSDLNGSPGRQLSVPVSQLTALLASGVSVPTPAMRGSLWWPQARRTAQVIPDGIDASRFEPRDRAEARRRRALPLEGKRAIVVTGPGMRREKRVELAQATVALLPEVTLEVVRDVPHVEMPLVYASADVLLMTSLKEGSPNCVREALACALPVVGVDVGDVRAAIEGLTNCAIVPAEPARLARAVAAALADGRGCPDGPRRVAERYSLEVTTRAFIRFYESVAVNRRPR